MERHETTMSLQVLRRRDLKPPLRAVRTRPDDRSGKETEEVREVARIGGRPRLPALRFPVGAEAREFYQRFHPGTSPAEWNDWHWQFRARIRSLAELSRVFKLSEDECAAVPYAGSAENPGRTFCNEASTALHRGVEVPRKAESIDGARLTGARP